MNKRIKDLVERARAVPVTDETIDQMEKRIKELAERAGWPVDINEQDMYETVGPKFAEEFAKLIVQECMDIADVESKNRTGHGRVAADAIWFTIKNRFGVE